MKPILFNTEMVRAILDGRKSVTRRVVKPQPDGDGSKPQPLVTRPGYWNTWGDDNVYRQPYSPDDILYVRETWAENPYVDGMYMYRAFVGTGCEPEKEDEAMRRMGLKWRPSIHMPKEAARLFLRVTNVWPQQLKNVTEEDAKAEGFNSRTEFFAAIMKMYPDCTEDSWFWVHEFERISREEAMSHENP